MVGKKSGRPHARFAACWAVFGLPAAVIAAALSWLAFESVGACLVAAGLVELVMLFSGSMCEAGSRE